jgi:putative endonuclease
MAFPQIKTQVGTSKQAGDAAEESALRHLQQAGLRLLERNYRSASHGGAAASISATKQRRIIFAARHYLMRLREPPPCRFDVVTLECGVIQWLQAAFEAY